MSKSVKIRMKGLSPLLMHAYPLVDIENPPLEKRPIEEQAELAAYRDPETKMLYIPGVAIQRALINGAAYSKGKGRASLQKQAAACLIVNPQRVSLGVTEYKIDSRPIVIPVTRGRVMRHRPIFEHWEISFELEWDESLLDEKQLREIVDNTGSRVGFLDFRPERKGPFGRAIVTEWKV